MDVAAQSPNEAFFIFRNDGNFNAFFRSQVDSIVYSNYDIDSIFHDEVKTQLIYCADSIFRIPLSAIDSIVFVKSMNGQEAVMGLSDNRYIYIPKQPACALINITGITSLPSKKGTDAHAWMEVWDGHGIYFIKKVIIDLNGDSSVAKEKRNFSADFCEDEWEGNETTDIKIGNWVIQDGFHFKANYTSITKGECPVCYKLFDKFIETKPLTKQAPYMEYYEDSYILDIINGSDEDQKEKIAARCHPDGFPCIVFLNGDFYGIYSWQLKKHRDNYNLSRNKTDNIHLDGVLGQDEFWNGKISWGGFEVRNPKPKENKWSLMCQDGSKYDSNSPKELMGTDSKFYDKSNISCVNTAQTKAHIVSLSKYMSEIADYEATYNNSSMEDKDSALSVVKKEIEKRFSMDWMIDYVLLQVLIQNGDCIRKNWQWVTWGEIDGKMKWFVNPYDLDHAFGVLATTAFRLIDPSKPTYGKGSKTPARYVWDYYFDDMSARYSELRNTGAISYETIWGLMKEWIESVGTDNYKKEAERWPEMPCNRDSHISSNWKWTGTSYLSYYDGPNTNGWNKSKSFSAGAYTKYNYRCYKSLKNNNTGHTPNEQNSEWWEDVTLVPGNYKAGDIVFDGRCNFYQFRALTDVVVSEDYTNNNRQDHLVGAPFDQFYSCYPYEGGVFDTPERIEKWIRDKIKLMDEQMGYKGDLQ